MNLKKIHLILFLKLCYNWTAFNTESTFTWIETCTIGFKPCSNWTTFNTDIMIYISIIIVMF